MRVVQLKTPEQIAKMKESGQVLAAILNELKHMPRVGMKTNEISVRAAALIKEHGVEPSFLHYNGYPDVICLSVNAQAVHTPGSDYELKDGDVLKLDFGVIKDGWHSDSAVTVLVASDPDAPEHKQKRKLIQVTRECLEKALAVCRPDGYLGDIGQAVQSHAESNGLTVVQELGGHGIGRKLHEEPWVSNAGKSHTGLKLEPGMVLAIEPIISTGGSKIRDGKDGHTYDMSDGSLAAQFEHTIAITAEGHEVLTS